MINMGIYNTQAYLDIIFPNKHEWGTVIRAGAPIWHYTVLHVVVASFLCILGLNAFP